MPAVALGVFCATCCASCATLRSEGAFVDFTWASSDAARLAGELHVMQRSRPGAQASNSDRARQACLGELIQRGKIDLLSAALARGASFGRLLFHHFEEHVNYDEASLQLRTQQPHALVDLPAPGRKPKTPASSSDQRVASHEVKLVKVLQTRCHHGFCH